MTHCQMYYTDIFRAFQPKVTEFTFFLSTHGTFSRIDHILGHKSGLNWYQKIGIIPCIFFAHTALKIELNHKRKVGKNSNTWRLKSILLKNEWVRAPGWLSGLKPLLLAQVMIPGSWDRAPHRALCSAGSLLPPLSACLSAYL